VNIPFSGTYTRENLMRFDRAVRKASGSTSLYTNAGCFGVAAIILLVLAIVQWTKSNQSGAFEWFILFIVAAVAAPSTWWSARRSFGRHPNLNHTVFGEVRGDGLQIKTPASDSTLTWKAFQSSYCAADYLLLFQTENSVIGLAIDFFRTPDDFASACKVVGEQVQGRPPGLSPRKRVFRILGWIVLIVFIFLVWSLFWSSK